MPKHNEITDENQNDPHPTRSEFLRGVMIQANIEGYSAAATGRLFVLAVRIFEGR